MAFRKISIRKDCDRCLLLRSAIDENNRRSGLWFKWNFGVGEGMGSKTLLMKLHPLLIIYTDFIITFFINNTPRDNADYCTCVGFRLR